jgi:sigma-B regulation protein RsbU (phosphoserine phosphatase)
LTEDPFDQAACALMQTSDDGVFRRVNRRFCEWVGYTKDELVGVLRLEDLLTAGGRLFHHTHWLPLLAMQGSISEVKLDVVHRDGSTIPMVINALRRQEAGAVVYEIAAFIARDRDRYERELVVTKKRLETLVEESRDRADFAEQMIGIVSHDLRNPLSTIGMASKLLATTDAVKREKMLGTIDRSLARAMRLISDLLDFTAARVGAGLSISLANIDLHATVAEALEALRVSYPARAITHTIVGSGTCLLDPQRIAQQLGNLVANAVTYGDPSTPIAVTSTVTEDRCSISVTNTGAPIPAETMATIFQPMMRGTAKGSASRSVGLGLFIVQHIAKAHGGTARVSSTPEATTFTIDLPRHGAIGSDGTALPSRA